MNSEIKNYDFRPGLPQEFEIVDLRELTREFKDLLTRPHRTGFYHIFWFGSGNLTHLVDFNACFMPRNSILFLNKDTVHRFDQNADYDGFAILFTEGFFCKSGTDSQYLRSTILFNDLIAVSQIQPESPHLQVLLQLMQAEFHNPKDHHQADILQNLLHNFLLLAEREHRKQNFTEFKKSIELEQVLTFKNLLENNFRKLKQVGDYAEAMSMTDKRLNLATAKILGKSPKQMIDARVMLEAKRLLAHTSDSAKEIGFALGFEEPTNFIKYFRKHSQVTPVEFRMQYK